MPEDASDAQAVCKRGLLLARAVRRADSRMRPASALALRQSGRILLSALRTALASNNPRLHTAWASLASYNSPPTPLPILIALANAHLPPESLWKSSSGDPGSMEYQFGTSPELITEH